MSEEQQIAEAPQGAPQEQALKGVVIDYDDSDDAGDEAPQAGEAEESPDPGPKTTEAEEGDGKEESQKARVEFTPEQQEFIESNIIASQVARRKAAEERLAAMEAEVAKYREQAPQQQAQTDPQTGEPVIPAMPDPFDADYEAKVEARDNAIRERAAWESRQAVEQERQREQYQQHIDSLNKRTESYISRGEEYGLTRDDIHRAGEFINNAGGVAVEVIDYVLDDDAGPAITDHLRRNPEDLQKLQSMPPHRAVAHLVSEVRPKAMRRAKRKSAPPPPPVATESGSGGNTERGLPGATYE